MRGPRFAEASGSRHSRTSRLAAFRKTPRHAKRAPPRRRRAGSPPGTISLSCERIEDDGSRWRADFSFFEVLTNRQSGAIHEDAVEIVRRTRVGRIATPSSKRGPRENRVLLTVPRSANGARFRPSISLRQPFSRVPRNASSRAKRVVARHPTARRTSPARPALRLSCLGVSRRPSPPRHRPPRRSRARATVPRKRNHREPDAHQALPRGRSREPPPRVFRATSPAPPRTSRTP